MTEQEARDRICDMVSLAEEHLSREEYEECDAAGVMAMEAFEEVRKYREIGTVEECKDAVKKMHPIRRV